MREIIEWCIENDRQILPVSTHKIPFIKQWQEKASSEKKQIETWRSKFLNCNWGLLAGDIILLDMDENHKPGISGKQTLKELEEIHGKLPDTVESDTPNGGDHRWFLVPKDIIIHNKTDIFPGIDVKGNRGFIMLPPSYIDGDAYKIGHLTGKKGDYYKWKPGHAPWEIKIAPLPQWWLDILYNKEAELQETALKRFGRAFSENSKGYVKELHQPFWAGIHSLIHIELYDPDEKEFYRYNNKTGIYEQITEHTIKGEISEYIFEMAKEQNRIDIADKRTNNFLQNTVNHLKSIIEKKNAFDRDKKFIHFKNGVLHFQENGITEFTGFSPDYYSRNQSPFDYDPNAKCDRFINELLKPAMSEDDISILQKYMGLCLLGNNIAQRFLILDGEPNRGKSRISKIIQAIVGAESVMQLRTQHLADRFELYRFRDKNLLIGVDVPGNFLQDKGASVIKGLIGGDIFNAEQKGGTGSFPILGNFCIVINSNSRLQTRLDGDVEAWRRRLLIIRFAMPISTKRIPEFDKVLLQEEGSGIINFALIGLLILFREIEEHGTMQLPESQHKIIDALLAESDSIRYFLKEKVESVGEGKEYDSNGLTTDELLVAYAEFCPTMGWNPKPITVIERDLAKLMLEMFNTVKSNHAGESRKQRGYTNVQFKITDTIEKVNDFKDTDLFDNTEHTEVVDEY